MSTLITDDKEEAPDILQVNWRYTVPKLEIKDTEDVKPKEGGKYKLRPGSVKKRIETEKRKHANKKLPKVKTPSMRMSKYRRKTANARERSRMGEINTTFEKLRSFVPGVNDAVITKTKWEKLTKINILHFAINYMRQLSSILESGEKGVDIYPEKLIENPFIKCEPFSESSQNYTIFPRSPSSYTSEGSTTCFSSTSPAYILPNNNCKIECMDDSSGEDSGIQEDSDVEYPDWTELNSTLDLSLPVELLQLSRQPKAVSVGLNTAYNPNAKVSKMKSVTLATRLPVKTHVQNLEKLNLLAKPGGKEEHSVPFSQNKPLGCDSGAEFFPENDELFSDLNSSFDSMADISFCYDDPFLSIFN